MRPHLCPTCGSHTFEKAITPGRLGWWCASCRGLVIELDSLQSHADPDQIGTLWSAVWGETSRSGPRCPGCGKAMVVFSVGAPGKLKDADVCPECQLFFVNSDTVELFLRTLGIGNLEYDP